MYDEKFSKIYDKYGWEYFSITMGNSILKYFESNNIIIKSNIDLCCGTGTLCNLFKENGIETVGVDKSKYMINIAKDKYPDIDFIEEDILTYKSKKKYDLITMTCDAINHLIGDDEIDKLFLNLSKLIKKNGYLIFDIYDKDKIEFSKEIVSVRENGIKVYYYITEKQNLINTNVIIKENDVDIYETNVIERLYGLDEIKKISNKYGFKILQASDKIMNETQRFKDKKYIICKNVL